MQRALSDHRGMNKFLYGPLTLALLSSVLSACGGGSPAPVPPAIPAAAATFTLGVGLGSAPWTYGAGTLTLRAYTGGATGPVIVTAPVDVTGHGTLTLPGSAGGIAEKANLPASAAVGVPLDTSGCLNELKETDPTAQALFLASGDFSTADGGVNVYERQLETMNGVITGFIIRVPTFVTRATTISGTVTCAKTKLNVDLPFSQGWNTLVFSVDTGSKEITLGVAPVSEFSFVSTTD